MRVQEKTSEWNRCLFLIGRWGYRGQLSSWSDAYSGCNGCKIYFSDHLYCANGISLIYIKAFRVNNVCKAFFNGAHHLVDKMPLFYPIFLPVCKGPIHSVNIPPKAVAINATIELINDMEFLLNNHATPSPKINFNQVGENCSYDQKGNYVLTVSHNK